jgi:hypothetical protein
MNYLEYSKSPSDNLNVHGAHITDLDVDATSTLLLQFLYLHFSVLVVFVFFMI